MTLDRDAVELLPCPFCGWKEPRLTANKHANMAWVACPDCGIEAPSESGVTGEDAVAYWNRRYALEALSAREATGGEAVGWETAAEWELEQRAFHAAGREDVPADVRATIGDLWRQYCLAAKPVEGEPTAQVCATHGCGKPATIRFERGGVGSDYCHDCYVRVQAVSPNHPTTHVPAALRSASIPPSGVAEPLSVDDIEALILRTEPDVPACVDGSKIWTRRMAAAMHAAIIPSPLAEARAEALEAADQIEGACGRIELVAGQMRSGSPSRGLLEEALSTIRALISTPSKEAE